jgi:hypothetical protein
MSKYISFKDLKNDYQNLHSLIVRVYGGMYGKDELFDRTFAGSNSEPQNTFPIAFSCTKNWGKSACTGTFDIGSSIHHALQKSMTEYTPGPTEYKGICGIIPPGGMTQGCMNLCQIEIHAEYSSSEE